ncbi:YheC/YheD family protein [Paenibacillaceae bacterium]|nr:YheC/YheD family protein [Paenibacillaceae bacterium]
MSPVSFMDFSSLDFSFLDVSCSLVRSSKSAYQVNNCSACFFCSCTSRAMLDCHTASKRSVSVVVAAGSAATSFNFPAFSCSICVSSTCTSASALPFVILFNAPPTICCRNGSHTKQYARPFPLVLPIPVLNWGNRGQISISCTICNYFLIQFKMEETMRKQRRYISNKWTKTVALQMNPQLRSYIPETRKMNRDSLLAMLQIHGMVYVKPSCGSLGEGVMRVQKLQADPPAEMNRSRQGRWRFQTGTTVRAFASYQHMYEAISKYTRGRSYLVQQGIRMLKHQGRPFDLRVMVQTNPAGVWEVTGIAARIAHRGKVVTNGSQGGTIHELDELEPFKAAPEFIERLQAALQEIGLRSARQMRRSYPAIREVGLDIALSSDFKPWILELNTKPDPRPFTMLKDKQPLNTIIAYGKALGRTYNLRATKARAGYLEKLPQTSSNPAAERNTVPDLQSRQPSVSATEGSQYAANDCLIADDVSPADR